MLAAISSSVGWVTELTKFIVPNSAAAFATATPPSGVIVCSEPIGAIITGMRSFWPRKVVEVSTFDTSTSTRGRKAKTVEAQAIAPHGGLRLRAAGEIIPDILRQDCGAPPE